MFEVLTTASADTCTILPPANKDTLLCNTGSEGMSLQLSANSRSSNLSKNRIMIVVTS